MKLRYEKEMITERDYYNMLNTAKADGLAAGLAEGRAEGREEGLIEGEAKGREEEKIRIAKAFKEQGVDAGIISFATGLSEAEVAEL